MTEDEKYVRDHITKIWPQLLVNARKTAGTAFDSYGLDVLTVCIEYFFNKPIQVQVDACKKNKAENFITYMMGLQLKSGTSYFYSAYRRHNEKQREFYVNYDYGENYLNFLELDEENECVTCIKEMAEKLDPYEKMIFQELLVQGNKLAPISKKYNIHYHHLKRDKQLVREKIKQVCKVFL
jgi:hypothetical protein